MQATSFSLLDRLKTARADDPDWERIQTMYRSLIVRWLRRVPGLNDEADDLTQEVLVVLVREIPQFDRRREGSFRAWLRQITVHRVRTWQRQQQRRPATNLDPGTGFLDQLADPAGALASEWDREHDKHVVEKLRAAVKPDFSVPTWEAFHQVAIAGTPAAVVATNLGISVNAVLQAKSRILKRLRAEAGELLQ